MGACFSTVKSNNKNEMEKNTNNQKVKNVYNIENLLGQGSFGKVFLATNKKDPSLKVAIKILNKSKLSKQDIEGIHQEVKILQTLDHPNIVKYYETYEDQKFLYLVMELCPKGELFENITEGKHFSEKDAALIMEKLLKAIIHCHASSISHRDIKPENIMFSQDGEIKLIDFGLAKQQTKKLDRMHTIAGTPYFIAPEVLKKNYTNECDIWSLGVLLYVMMTGVYPFDVKTNNRDDLFAKIQKGEFGYPPEVDSKLTPECKELIKKMICVNQQNRLTASQCLEHPWFKRMLGNQDDEGYVISSTVVEKLREFRGQSKFKKAALNVLVKMLNSKELENLKKEFQKIDTDNSGFIELSELENALQNANCDMTANEIKQIVQEINYSGSNKINYSEFLAATISLRQFLTEQKIEAIFKQFDVDNSGFLTAQNIKDALEKMGKDITSEEAEEIIKQHDLTGDSKISLDEFRQILLSKTM